MQKSLRHARQRVLDVGAGSAGSPRVHAVFSGWDVVRQDINPAVQPDVVGNITDLRGKVADASFDAVWSSHNIEHLYSHEVPLALGEMRRVLKADGFALITCPDLEQVARLLLSGDMERTVYTSPAGPISVLDMVFGHSASIAAGNTYMAHNTGFTTTRLGNVLRNAGFAESWVAPGPAIDLWAVALMPKADTARVKAMLAKTPQSFLVTA